jgi:hypothetical protein
MNRKNGNWHPLVLVALIFGSSVAIAQESLSACTSQKTHQMELMRTIKSAPPPRVDPYTHRTYSSFDKVKAQEDVNRIDEWLWKNCREFSNEMRSIEQQYM